MGLKSMTLIEDLRANMLILQRVCCVKGKPSFSDGADSPDLNIHESLDHEAIVYALRAAAVACDETELDIRISCP